MCRDVQLCREMSSGNCPQECLGELSEMGKCVGVCLREEYSRGGKFFMGKRPGAFSKGEMSGGLFGEIFCGEDFFARKYPMQDYMSLH